MKKALAVAVCLMFIATAAVAIAGPGGNSNIGHLYLYEKVPSGTWPIVEDGAWGKMTYTLSGAEFAFVFNAKGLVPETDYTLIYYEDPGPGTWVELPKIICLGSGIANNAGNVHIAGSADTGDLPTIDDVNYGNGAKIWLVPSSFVDCENGVWASWSWSPTEYLFEGDLINFEDMDD